MREYLKKAPRTARTDASDVTATVQEILADIEARGESAARGYAAKFDRYEGPVVLGPDEIAAAEAAIGLAILVTFFRNKDSIDIKDIRSLKG